MPISFPKSAKLELSLLPAFAGEQLDRNALYWEHEGNRAVRQGDWKLVAKSAGPWELYRIDQDRSELHDLAGAQPQQVELLANKWTAWAERANVLPLKPYSKN